ncbi:MAG: hypothetical protein FWF46_04745 [Oscillospiraceae bacterium]|nr:hypothetical protein [Oscillospiraceae bacterium]
MEEIVKLDINYTYEILINDISRLKNRYPFLETRKHWRKCNEKASSLY